MKSLRTRSVCLLALAFTFFFFAEYLSPLRRVHIPFDLETYHYPLADYAFQAFCEHRFPAWDWTIYSGQSFAGNLQAALFYPPMWLVFAVNAGRAHVSYQSLQVLVIAHIWLAFVLAYGWLRSRQLSGVASAIGAGVFAYGGYGMLNLQHLGLIAGYAWFPLGFWGVSKRYWRLVVASTLCCLAGYPPVWMTFAVAVVVYALASNFRLKTAVCVVAGLGVSLAIAAVQLLPAWEASAWKIPEQKYGGGVSLRSTVLSLFVPNSPPDYLYLGAAGVLGLLFAIRRRKWKDLLPFVAVGFVSLILVTNPAGAVWYFLRHSPLLAEVCRSWYFLPGVVIALASLSAYGWDDFLSRAGNPFAKSVPALAGFLLLVWAGWELWRRLSGWNSAFDVASSIAIVLLEVYAIRAAHGRSKALLTAILLLAIGVEWKADGTGKQFDARPGSGQPYFASDFFPLIDAGTYSRIRADRGYRILVDRTGPYVLDLRHYPGLRSPQGFDPFLSLRYFQMIGASHFRTDREFDIGPEETDLLQLLGVKYFLAAGDSPVEKRYEASAAFRRIPQMARPAYLVFEYRNPRPAYGWETEDSGRAEITEWTPETRAFQVSSPAGGRFVLKEQWYPGWSAFLDGTQMRLDRWRGAFQAVSIPGGTHALRFHYRPEGLRTGAWISLVSLAGFLLALRFLHAQPAQKDE